MTTQQGPTGGLNAKQYKLWLDILNAKDGDWLELAKLASEHNYTRREVSTAVRRMDDGHLEIDEGYVRFNGSAEERSAFRCSLTARRYDISDDMCHAVSECIRGEWKTVTTIANETGIATIAVSRTITVLGAGVQRRSCSTGVFYKS